MVVNITFTRFRKKQKISSILEKILTRMYFGGYIINCQVLSGFQGFGLCYNHLHNVINKKLAGPIFKSSIDNSCKNLQVLQKRREKGVD